MSTNARLCRGLLVSIGLALVACGDDTGPGGAGGQSTGGQGGNGGEGTGGDGTGGEASGGGGAAPGDDVQAFCDAVVVPFCDALFACCTDPDILADVGGTVEACRAGFGDTCVDELASALGDPIAAGITALDDTRLAACTARLGEIEASCDEPPQLAFFFCISAFKGTVAPGEPCGDAPNDVSFIECDGGLCGLDSTCIAFLEDGAQCDPANDPAAFCDFTAGEWCNGASNTCTPRGEAGDACNEATGEKYQCLSLNCVGSMCEAPTSENLCDGAG